MQMKKHYLTLLLCFATLFAATAQKIETQKVFGGYKFRLNGEKLSYFELDEMMYSNPAAHRFMRKARTQNIIADVIGGVGGWFVGWELGNMVWRKPLRLEYLAAGAFGILISLPLESASQKNALKAVDLHNSEVKTTFLKNKPTLNLVSRGNGIGLVMTF